MSLSKRKVYPPGTKGWARQPPPRQAFIWYTLEMLRSPAFKNLRTPTRIFVNFLEVQYLAGGAERNGHLVAPYLQLAEEGIHKNAISGAIKDAMTRRLVARTREGVYRGYSRGDPATYRLTYLPTRKGTGGDDWELPTHEWREYPHKPDTKTDTKNDTVPAKTRHRVLIEGDETPRQAANES